MQGENEEGTPIVLDIESKQEELLRHVLRVGIHVSLLVAVPGLAAWAWGKPLIFPSLGPSAFALGISSNKTESGRSVIGGHFVGVVGGLLAYHLLATGLTLENIPPAWSFDGFRLAMSGVLSILLTTAAMLLTQTSHAPACATTLIISLGLLPTFPDGGIILLAVVGLFGVHKLLSRAEFLDRLSPPTVGPRDRLHN
jgi:hypothetical protein